MDNTTNSRHNPHQEQRRQLKKNYRYNDSLSKYKKAKQKIESNQNKMDASLKNLNSGITEISTDNNEKEKKSNYLPIKKYDWTSRTRISLSAPKYHFLKPSTPKRDYNLKKKNQYINTPKTLNNSSYYKTSENFSQYTDTDISNRYNDLIPPKARDFSKPNYRSILSTEFNSNTIRKTGVNNDFNNYTLINGDGSKNKELITLNNILQKQNKELRQKTREMRYKINELLNNIKLIRMDNQRLNNEKKNYY